MVKRAYGPVKRAYGLGSGSPRDVTRTDEPRPLEPGDSRRMPLPQTFEGPAVSDYDTPDNLTFDHNNQMPYHEGAAPRAGEVGFNLKELTGEPPTRDLDTQSQWADTSLEESGLRLGQRAPWVAIDLDGTLLGHPPKDAPEYNSLVEMLPLGPPLPGAAAAIHELVSLGWRVSIYTARFGEVDIDDETVSRWAARIAEHLERLQIPFSDIWVGRKPRCDFFVDDKAIAFDGDWPDVLEALTSSAHRASGGPLDYDEGPNDFDDPLGFRENRGIDRPPELEESLYG